MRNRTSSRTGLFLMELILAVLLFALASILCVQMFVKSHTLSKSSVELNHAVLWTQNVAEGFYGCMGTSDALAALFPESICKASNESNYRLLLYFNEEFEPITISSENLKHTDYSYQLSATVTKESDDLLSCHIVVSKTNQAETIYELTLSLYTGKEVFHES